MSTVPPSDQKLRGGTKRENAEILMAAKGLKSSQSKQRRLAQQQQTTGLSAIWPWGFSTEWPSGSLRRCPLIFPRCLSKESAAGPASGRDGISDSALLGFLDRHGGTFWKRKALENMMAVLFVKAFFFLSDLEYHQKTANGNRLQTIDCFGLSFWFVHLVRFTVS